LLKVAVEFAEVFLRFLAINLKHERLGAFDIKCRYVKGFSVAGDFDNVVTVAELLAFFVKNDSVFIHDSGLLVDHSSRFEQFFGRLHSGRRVFRLHQRCTAVGLELLSLH
jgi:hypothetical protein